MWEAAGRRGFVDGILRQHLNVHILGVHEKLARDAMLENVGSGGKHYAGGATDFSGLAANSSYAFPLKSVRDIKLRLSVRAKYTLQNFGDYARPVPGNGDLLLITTPGVVFDQWDKMDGEHMINLRDLQDERIINGGAVRYQGVTWVETWDALLWNAGPISKQVGVTQAIKAGDGAPDPDVEAVDGVFYTGQSSGEITHYVQCTDFDAADFAAGDFVTLHTARTNAWGITNGNDFLHGKSIVLEVYAVDATNNRLVFRLPVMDDYAEGFIATPQGGSSGTYYAFVTKAQHVHPVFTIGARGGNRFAIRRPIKIHTPPAIDDFESVVRVSWDEYGEMNKWNPDLWEVHFVAGSFANRGEVGY